MTARQAKALALADEAAKDTLAKAAKSGADEEAERAKGPGAKKEAKGPGVGRGYKGPTQLEGLSIGEGRRVAGEPANT